MLNKMPWDQFWGLLKYFVEKKSDIFFIYLLFVLNFHLHCNKKKKKKCTKNLRIEIV